PAFELVLQRLLRRHRHAEGVEAVREAGAGQRRIEERPGRSGICRARAVEQVEWIPGTCIIVACRVHGLAVRRADARLTGRLAPVRLMTPLCRWATRGGSTALMRNVQSQCVECSIFRARRVRRAGITIAGEETVR